MAPYVSATANFHEQQYMWLKNVYCFCKWMKESDIQGLLRWEISEHVQNTSETCNVIFHTHLKGCCYMIWICIWLLKKMELCTNTYNLWRLTALKHEFTVDGSLCHNNQLGSAAPTVCISLMVHISPTGLLFGSLANLRCKGQRWTNCNS